MAAEGSVWLCFSMRREQSSPELAMPELPIPFQRSLLPTKHEEHQLCLQSHYLRVHGLAHRDPQALQRVLLHTEVTALEERAREQSTAQPWASPGKEHSPHTSRSGLGPRHSCPTFCLTLSEPSQTSQRVAEYTAP